jgi:hypothetical protein
MEHFSTELDSLKRREPAAKKLEEQEQEVRGGFEIVFREFRELRYSTKSFPFPRNNQFDAKFLQFLKRFFAKLCEIPISRNEFQKVCKILVWLSPNRNR